MDDPSRRLTNNRMTYNQLEMFLMEILHGLMQDGENPPERTLEEHIHFIFGDQNAIHMDIRDPETLLSILRVDHGDLYKQLFCSAVLAIKTIISCFAEDRLLQIEPRIISQPFISVFFHLYPENFNIEQFRRNLEEIPYYTERLAVRQNTNAFILTASRIFCTIDHCQQIETVLL